MPLNLLNLIRHVFRRNKHPTDEEKNIEEVRLSKPATPTKSAKTEDSDTESWAASEQDQPMINYWKDEDASAAFVKSDTDYSEQPGEEPEQPPIHRHHKNKTKERKKQDVDTQGNKPQGRRKVRS